METPSSVTSREYHGRIERGFQNLQNEVFDLMNHEKSAQETIQQLERDLNAYKRALDSSESECDRLRKHQDDVSKENESLREQVKVTGNRVITLIDGDGSIFSSELISQAQEGGCLAARSLSGSITQYLSENYTARPYQLWVYLFFNKRGLMDTFARVGLSSLNRSFEDFIMGFNQADDRFSMVDVGSMKEATDAKLKAHIEDDIRLPQTFKIIFGGCHDNGYLHSLHSQITAGFRHKLILLKGYTQMAPAIKALELPTLHIEDLFLAQKLVSSPNKIVTNMDTLDTSPANFVGTLEEGGTATPSYSRVLQRTAPSSRENPRECSPATETSWEGPYTSTGNAGTRCVNPHVRLSKQTPPPCMLFYLSNCKLGANCKFGHDYLLNDEQFEELSHNARLGPCPDINRGEICTWGEACIYGHICPHAPKCPFQKLGKCRFRGVDMHSGDPALGIIT